MITSGYRGESAHRIWSSIYSENCFFRHKSSSSHHNPFSLSNYDEPSSSSLPLCYEERIFYRVISGLHSSINIHLSASYPVLKGSNTFGPNLQEFKNRFEGMIRSLYPVSFDLIIWSIHKNRTRRVPEELVFRLSFGTEGSDSNRVSPLNSSQLFQPELKSWWTLDSHQRCHQESFKNSQVSIPCFVN